jgi:nucleotide-binding universal stress UspA family protein
MYDRILFPTDGSDGAAAVLDHVLDVAATHDATLYVLYVADTTHDSAIRIGGTVVDALEREGERVVEETAERAEKRGVSTVTDVLQGGVSGTITAYAEEHDVDIVAMPTHGRTGIERVLLGSVTERVLRSATVPVLVFPPDAELTRYPYQSVLVPTDGSECASAALDHVAGIVRGEETMLHVLSVVDVASLGMDVRSQLQVETLEEHAQQVVDDAREAVETASTVGAVKHGHPIHEAILSHVDEHDVDLVVMGTHGRSGVNRYLLGSVTEKIVRTAPVPVLAVPAPSVE